MNDRDFMGSIKQLYATGASVKQYQEMAALPVSGELKSEQITPENMSILHDVCADGTLTGEEKAKITPFLSSNVITGIFGQDGKQLISTRFTLAQREISQLANGTITELSFDHRDWALGISPDQAAQLLAVLAGSIKRADQRASTFAKLEDSWEEKADHCSDTNSENNRCNELDRRRHEAYEKHWGAVDAISSLKALSQDLFMYADSCPPAMRAYMRSGRADQGMFDAYISIHGEAGDYPALIREIETNDGSLGAIYRNLGVLGERVPEVADKLKQRLEQMTQLDDDYAQTLDALERTGRHIEFVKQCHQRMDPIVADKLKQRLEQIMKYNGTKDRDFVPTLNQIEKTGMYPEFVKRCREMLGATPKN